MTFNLDTISQLVIAVLGVIAILLISLKNRWGFVIGILTQPFWFITTILNHQWLLVFVSFAYTISWAIGIYEWFFKNGKKKK